MREWETRNKKDEKHEPGFFGKNVMEAHYRAGKTVGQNSSCKVCER